LKIRQIHKLNKKQKLDIVNLVKECLLVDGLKRTLYLRNDINFYENLDSFYLLYDNEKLVSVLTIFQPKETEAEISAYTLPDERNKGYFTELLDCAEEELIGFDIVHIIFVVEPESKCGTYALAACQAKYIKSEYLLTLNIAEWIPRMNIFNKEQYKDAMNGDNKIEDQLNQFMKLVELQPQNVKEADILSAAIFGTEIDEDLSILDDALESEKIVKYCAYFANTMIGICKVNYGTNNASIFGLGIAPQYQGKGYGRELINLLLEKISDQNAKYVTLEVGSENQRAFSLYKSVGFQIKTQYDYHEYIIECEEIN